MSINGIRGPYSNAVRPQATSTVRPSGTQPATGGAQRATTAAQPQSATALKGVAPSAGNAVPVQPPQGTDPELWSVLTQDERAYFAKLGAMGPLTYGRVLSGQMPVQAPAVRGGRLDVKA
ncbi:MAG: hypothetical protein IT359_07920 [Gemmatimonadaceae bacterium]|nr:hypothetical protein [Gemmatimonadaceae bacterium]